MLFTKVVGYSLPRFLASKLEGNRIQHKILLHNNTYMNMNQTNVLLNAIFTAAFGTVRAKVTYLGI